MDIGNKLIKSSGYKVEVNIDLAAYGCDSRLGLQRQDNVLVSVALTCHNTTLMPLTPSFATPAAISASPLSKSPP